jgi:hypothetical protein
MCFTARRIIGCYGASIISLHVLVLIDFGSISALKIQESHLNVFKGLPHGEIRRLNVLETASVGFVLKVDVSPYIGDRLPLH